MALRRGFRRFRGGHFSSSGVFGFGLKVRNTGLGPRRRHRRQERRLCPRSTEAGLGSGTPLPERPAWTLQIPRPSGRSAVITSLRPRSPMAAVAPRDPAEVNARSRGPPHPSPPRPFRPERGAGPGPGVRGAPVSERRRDGVR